MVSLDQIKRGAARYLDEEFTKKLSGWQRWVIGAAGAMMLENLDASLLAFKDHPLVKSLGVMDEAGNVDLDRVYSYVMTEAKKGPVTFTAPLLGPVTLNERDVEKLYTCIAQA